MQTVFSHIVQKKLSQENENVATEALAFVLQSHKSAHNGMMRLLRGVDPRMPRLWFRTQQTEGGKQIGGSSRPDMQGCDEGGQLQVFIENKFWAGLTANQPVSYLHRLAERTQPTILLVVGPEARQETLWRALSQGLAKDKISATNDSFAGIFRVATTSTGPILALTSWRALLDALEPEVADDISARSDLLQLRALCAAADSEAFLPISSEATSDQRTPALILQLGAVVQATVDRAVNKGILNLKDTRTQGATERIGRYVYFGAERRVAPWLGIHFGLWKKHGVTPLWVVFAASEWGRAPKVQALLEPWAFQQHVFTTTQEDGSFVVALDIASGEDKDQVVAGIVARLEEMVGCLAALEPRAEGNLSNG